VGTRAFIPALIGFTRGTTSIFPNGRTTPLAPRPGITGNSYKYLHGTVFEITDPGGDLAAARIDHPAVDRLAAALDPCVPAFGGTTLDNTLLINDLVVPNTP
jgi:hypothetical protein